MTRPLDLTKPPFQTDENPPRKVELLKDHIKTASDHSVVWLITNYCGTQYISTSKPDGTSPGNFLIVNAPRRIPFWILPNQQGGKFGMYYITKCPSEYSAAKWRGPFWMDEDGNPVSGGDE